MLVWEQQGQIPTYNPGLVSVHGSCLVLRPFNTDRSSGSVLALCNSVELSLLTAAMARTLQLPDGALRCLRRHL